MEFSRPEYWSGQSFPSPGYLLNLGMEPRSPTLQADSLPAELSEKSYLVYEHIKNDHLGMIYLFSLICTLYMILQISYLV